MARDDRTDLPVEPREALGRARPVNHRRAKRGMSARGRTPLTPTAIHRRDVLRADAADTTAALPRGESWIDSVPIVSGDA
jgi:hypothetical protein